MGKSKLVRDKIPEIIRENGKEPIIHIADNKEYWEKLKSKLKEEVDEYFINDSEEELADILEVIDAIKDFKKIDEKRIQTIKKKKFNERGGFKERIILKKVR